MNEVSPQIIVRQPLKSGTANLFLQEENTAVPDCPTFANVDLEFGYIGEVSIRLHSREEALQTYDALMDAALALRPLVEQLPMTTAP